MYTDASKQAFLLDSALPVDDIFNEHRIREISRESMLINFKCMICNPTLRFESKEVLYQHLFEDRTHRQLFSQFVSRLNMHNN